jgi:hypothetical protein
VNGFEMLYEDGFQKHLQIMYEMLLKGNVYKRCSSAKLHGYTRQV